MGQEWVDSRATDSVHCLFNAVWNRKVASYRYQN